MEPGTQLGHYTVVTAIGKGGMGEVWRGRDTKLGREVAIKTLPPEFSRDPDRLARFEREAKLLASLNHPNIASIYGFEENNGTHFLVMELVEGDTLAERLRRGAIPPEESLKLALQIAEALEAAHDKGVVHRDLKPANIKATEDGTIKVLDFGLAKALGAAESNINLSNSPTISMAATQQGVILGTAAYMSPEQARGKTVDKRADIWSFGVVLYEMLTGLQAFGDEDISMTLSKVLQRDPDFDALPPEVPARVKQALKVCLQKDLRRRASDIHDVRLALDGAFDVQQSSVETAAAGIPRRFAVIASVAAVALVAVGLLAGRAWFSSAGIPGPAEPTYLTLPLEAGQRLSAGIAVDDRLGLQRPSQESFALSPDGRRLIYVATDGQTTRLFDRPLNRARTTPLAGTEGARTLLVSPDGRSVTYTSPGGPRRVDLESGDVRTIAFPPLERTLPGGSWAANDTFILSTGATIVSIPSAGGNPTVLAEMEGDASGATTQFRHPSLLPGGRALLFNIGEGAVPSDWDIAVQSLEGGERKVVVSGGSDPQYLPTGHLVFMRRGALMAVPFDLERLEATADPVVVAENVMHAEGGGNSGLNTGVGQFSVSSSGTLAYVPGGVYPALQGQLGLLDRAGAAEPISLPPAQYLFPRFSPDGSRLAYSIGDFADRQIWVFDLRLKVPTRFTSTGVNAYPTWSPDGRELAFSRSAGADAGLYVIAADGSGTPRRLTSESGDQIGSWSRDGVLAFLRDGDIWTVNADGSAEPKPFRMTPANERYPVFSPDGKWIAYVSNEAGSPDLYVRPFPGGEPAVRITTGGAGQPVWSPDGRQLFWTGPSAGPDGKPSLWSVDVDPSGTEFSRGQPHQLFESDWLAGSTPIGSIDISPDGRRFVGYLRIPGTPEPVTRIQIVQNWFEELKRLVPIR